MSDPNPQEGIAPGGQPLPSPTGAIGPGAPPQPAPLVKKSYERYDDDGDLALPSLAKPGAADGPGLQSLAQAARGKQLGQIRWTLLIIGGLTIALNVFILATNPEELIQNRAITLMFIALGGAYIALGIFVKAQPVFCTTLGLVLYILGFAVTLVLNPATIVQGLIVKIIIVVALARAIGSARAYELERNQFSPED
jgi:hypothetical protein